MYRLQPQSCMAGFPSDCRHDPGVVIGNTGERLRLDRTAIDRAQDAESQKRRQYACYHALFCGTPRASLRRTPRLRGSNRARSGV